MQDANVQLTIKESPFLLPPQKHVALYCYKDKLDDKKLPQCAFDTRELH